MKQAVVVVGHNVEGTIASVLQRLPSDLDLIVVDDGSTDGTLQQIEDRGVVVQHSENLGYGAAQKSGYLKALERGAERILLFHGDDQYEMTDCLALLSALDEGDVALGSRFLMPDRGRIIPWWRRWANRGLTSLANVRLGLCLTDMHTGARAYRAEALESLDFHSFSNDYVFDQQLLVSAARKGFRFVERPQRTRYDEEIQSISFSASVRYGLGCVRSILAP